MQKLLSGYSYLMAKMHFLSQKSIFCHINIFYQFDFYLSEKMASSGSWQETCHRFHIVSFSMQNVVTDWASTKLLFFFL